jgi:hypothetical protein
LSAKVIKTITDISEQGMSEPYRCIAEDDTEYYAKGLRSTRTSQINEWLCANMAAAIGLPIAQFSLLDVPEYLFEELSDQQKKIGLGYCFGSQTVHHVTLLEEANIKHIPIEIQQQIVAFDWLIKNGDRTRGNPNLLYQPTSKKIVVIDHNLAFDKELTGGEFLENHIFRDAMLSIISDYVLQSELIDCLIPALRAYQNACNNLPPEWRWLNNERDLKTEYNFQFSLDTLNRLNNGQLWRLT